MAVFGQWLLVAVLRWPTGKLEHLNTFSLINFRLAMLLLLMDLLMSWQTTESIQVPQVKLKLTNTPRLFWI